jgi:signal transduction histidine kinase
MITLNDWVHRYAKLPLIRLVIMALGVQFLYFSYLTYNRYINQLERIEQMREAISLGVQQSNRPLIESAMTSALVNSDITLTVLCAGAEINVSYPPSEDGCRLRARNPWRWSVRKPLVGVQGLDLVVVLCPLAAFGPLLFLMFITIAMLASIIWSMSRVSRRLEAELLKPLSEGLNGEVPLKVSELDDLRCRNLEHVRLVREQAASEAMIRLSAQVAHDIRSPLAALDAAFKNTLDLPEEQRVMVRHAVNRIRDIANNLLEKNRQQAKAASGVHNLSGGDGAGGPLETHLLSSLMDPVITEKRLQFESKSGINIDLGLSQSSYGLFAKIRPVEFKRMISNLVNNAVEALGEKGAVNLGLAYENKNITITVFDNGKGVPPEVLSKLGQRGETHGKSGGSGLGLYHARTSVESWGGALHIESAIGKGTTVTLTLPAARPPDWFVSGLELGPNSTVVILDDDTSIHQVWQGRFESLRVKEHGLQIHHFSAPDELRGWVKNNALVAQTALYLTDYELIGYKETGLSLVEELNLGPQAILVTSRYEEKQVLADCLRLKVRMIPKGLAGLIPMRIVANGECLAAGAAKPVESETGNNAANFVSPVSKPPTVLIDDDALVHMNWKMAARAGGVELQAYKDPEAFVAGMSTLSKDTPIYIDSDLGNDIKGENIAKDLHEKGFTNLTMATGYGPEKFIHLPWLKVTGKEPPFGK